MRSREMVLTDKFSRFNPRITAYHGENALALGYAADLAYSKPESVESTLRSWGFQEVDFLSASTRMIDTQCFVAATPSCILVSFRGTQEFKDWLTDAEINLIPGPGGYLVHEGFNRALLSVWNHVWRLIEQYQVQFSTTQPTLWFTGHSLGAALATLATAHTLMEKLRPVQGLYNFGSPRVGNDTFQTAFDRGFESQSFRFVNNNDVVTTIPPAGFILRYRHIGTLRYFDEDGDLFEYIGFWHRLLDCLEGVYKDIGKPGLDFFKDHSMEDYIKLLKKNRHRDHLSNRVGESLFLQS